MMLFNFRYFDIWREKRYIQHKKIFPKCISIQQTRLQKHKILFLWCSSFTLHKDLFCKKILPDISLYRVCHLTLRLAKCYEVSFTFLQHWTDVYKGVKWCWKQDNRRVKVWNINFLIKNMLLSLFLEKADLYYLLEFSSIIFYIFPGTKIVLSALVLIFCTTTWVWLICVLLFCRCSEIH